METGRRWFAIINALLSAALIGLIAWAILNRQALVDWWRLQTFKPSSAIARLADNDTMIGRGRDLFFASQPIVESGQVFSSDCTNTSEQSIVLGCYRAQQIYLFDVTDPRLNGVEEVTAAHEMLHAAYERLSDGERTQVNAWLEPQIQRMTDPRILGLIALYNKSEPGELYNEMHSILGTEYRELSPELESYYSRYFTDRKKVVTYSENYEAVFSASQQRIADMDAQLATWKTQINTDNATLDQQQGSLNAQASQLNSLRAQGKTDQYNAAVPGYNQQVRAFNTLVGETKQLIAEYNALVEARNKEAAAQNDLYQSLDSRHQTVQTNE